MSIMLKSVKNIIKDKQGFFRNVSILTICNMIVIILNLFINMYLARVLKPEGYGQYGFVVALSNILVTISSLGIQQVVMRRVAQNQQASWKEFKISMIARMLGYLAFLLPFLLYCHFLDKTTPMLTMMIVLNALVLTTWSGIQNIAFGMQRMEYTGYINMGATVVILLLYIIYPKSKISVNVALLTLVVVSLVKDILYYYKCHQENLFTGNDDHSVTRTEIIALVRESFPFYCLAIFTLFSTDWPVVFLNNHSGSVEVAYYDSANKILKPAAIILTTIMSALLPNLSKEYVRNKQMFAHKVNMMFKTLILVGTLICFFISLFRKEIVYIVFGEDYKSTGDVLLAQCWYVVFHALFALFGNALAAMHKEKLLMILSMIYAIVCFLIFWPTSYYGAMALSRGVVFMCIINMIYHFVYFKKNLAGFISYKEALSLFGITLVVLIISFSIDDINYLFYKLIFVSLLFLIIFLYRKKFSHYISSD